MPDRKPCLHCTLNAAISAFYLDQSPERGPNGEDIRDVSEVIGALMNLVGDVVHQAPPEFRGEVVMLACAALQHAINNHPRAGVEIGTRH